MDYRVRRGRGERWGKCWGFFPMAESIGRAQRKWRDTPHTSDPLRRPYGNRSP